MLLFPTILINPNNILKIETKKQIRVATRTYTEESMKSSVNKSSINAGDTTHHGLKKIESLPNKPLKPSLKKAKEEVSGSENIDGSVIEPNNALSVNVNIKNG
jgi:flagella basal body P-ring formation protein FlgA